MEKPQWVAKARELKARNPKLTPNAIARILKLPVTKSTVRYWLLSKEQREKRRAQTRARARIRKPVKPSYIPRSKSKIKKAAMVAEMAKQAHMANVEALNRYGINDTDFVTEYGKFIKDYLT
jgi:hypothetical protein